MGYGIRHPNCVRRWFLGYGAYESGIINHGYIKVPGVERSAEGANGKPEAIVVQGGAKRQTKTYAIWIGYSISESGRVDCSDKGFRSGYITR